MFCCNCGNQLLANVNFCSVCGHKVSIQTVDYNKLCKINNLMCFDGKPFTGTGVSYYLERQKKMKKHS